MTDDAFVAVVISEAARCQVAGPDGEHGLAERICTALRVSPLRRIEVGRILAEHREEIRVETEHQRSRVSGGKAWVDGVGLSTSYPQAAVVSKTRREKIRETRESIEVRAWYCLWLAVGQLHDALLEGGMSVRDRVSVAHFFRELALEPWENPADMLREIRIVACDESGRPLRLPEADDPFPELEAESSPDGLVIQPDEETDR